MRLLQRASDTIAPTRVIGLYPLPCFPAGNYSAGVRVRICETRLGRNIALGGIKHLGRLEQVLASLEVPQEEIDEGLMLDVDGHVIEGIRSNIFLIRNGAVLTPALDYSGVAGVMRAALLDEFRERKLPFEIRSLDLDELLEADEIFLSNSIFGVWGIREIAGYAWHKKIGPVTRDMIETFVHMGDPACVS